MTSEYLVTAVFGVYDGGKTVFSFSKPYVVLCVFNDDGSVRHLCRPIW